MKKTIIFIKKLWLILCLDISLIVCFSFGLYMEAPENRRFYLLLLTFVFLILSVNLKEIGIVRNSRFYRHTFFIDTILLYTLESSSKYLINYYLHIIYLLFIIYCGIVMTKKIGIANNIINFMISIIKFLRLVQFNPTASNISMSVFNSLAFILTILVIYYGKHQLEERERISLLYSELKNYSRKVRELTIAEERNRIAMEIHDTAGHHMTGLITELEMCKRLLNKDNAQVETLLNDALQTARRGLIDMRRAVDALKPNNLNINSIKEMLDQYRLKSGLSINLNFENDKVSLSSSQTTVIYRIIQEALTNTARHSNASEFNIELMQNSNLINIHIWDNGSRNVCVKEGNGLVGMRKRIDSLGGDIRYLYKNGFNIFLSFPAAMEVI